MKISASTEIVSIYLQKTLIELDCCLLPHCKWFFRISLPARLVSHVQNVLCV